MSARLIVRAILVIRKSFQRTALLARWRKSKKKAALFFAGYPGRTYILTARLLPAELRRGLLVRRHVNQSAKATRSTELENPETNFAPAAPSVSHIELVADLVSAYVSNNSIRPADLPDFIASVHASIQSLSKGRVEEPPAQPLVPAVPIKKSLTQDHLICLEDGKKFRSLKRHLGTVYNMTPDEYRAKWGLPKDYPMVAPGYSAIRSKLAKDIGLGQTRGEEAEPEKPPVSTGRRKRAAAAE